MAQNKRPKKRYVRPAECFFCTEGVSPDYKNYKSLLDFMTARDAIKPKKYSGICSKHQRDLGREVKRARELALLPFKPAE